MQKEPFHFNKGFSLVEVILASALALLLVTTIITGYLYGQESSVIAGKRISAVLLAEEGLEAARSIQDKDFATLTSGTHGIATSSNVWILSGTSDTVDQYTRELVITDVDANRKDVTANVTWQQTLGRTGIVSLTTRFTNWMREFVVVGNWAAATTTSIFDISGNSDGTKIAIQGDYAYVLTAGNPSFIVLDLSDPLNPIIADTLNLNGTSYNIYVAGDYAYIASGSNSQELQIVDITDPTNVSTIGTYNDSGNEDARGVFVVGTTAYLAMNGGNDLVAVNVTNKANPTFLGGVTLSGSAYEVAVIGSYAYVSSNANNQELQVVNILTPSAPSFVASLDLVGNDDGITITGAGSTVIVGRDGNGGIHTVSVSNPLVPSELDVHYVTAPVNDVALGVGDTYLFVATNFATGEFQVFDITDPSNITPAGSLNLAGGLNGVAYDSTLDIVVGAGQDNNEEVYVFSPS